MRASILQGLLDANVHDIPFNAQNHQVTAVYEEARLRLHAPSEGYHPTTCRHLKALHEGTQAARGRLMRDCTVAHALRQVPEGTQVAVCPDCRLFNDDLTVLRTMLYEANLAEEVAARLVRVLESTQWLGGPTTLRSWAFEFRRQVGLTTSTEYALAAKSHPEPCADPALESWWHNRFSAWWAKAEQLRVASREEVDGWDEPLCYVAPHDQLWTVPSGGLTRWLAGAEVAAYAPGHHTDFQALPVFVVPQRAWAQTRLDGWAHLGPVGAGAPLTDRLHGYQALRENEQHTDQRVVDAMVTALA